MHLKHLVLIALLSCWRGWVKADNRPCPTMPVRGARQLINTTCRDVERRLARVPGSAVRMSARSFVDPRFACTREGCVVTLKGSFQALTNQATPDSWLAEYLRAKGWSRTLSHDADGPNGTLYALHQPGALCIVEGTWNHWHDDNGESHTNDAYEVTVSCGGAEESPPEPEEAAGRQTGGTSRRLGAND